MSAKPAYKRILLKVSGEALMGSQGFGIDPAMTKQIATDIKAASRTGLRDRNCRWRWKYFSRRGTCSQRCGPCNRRPHGHFGDHDECALALRMAIEEAGIGCVVMNAIEMPRITETFNQRALDAHMAAGKVVVFAGGTGNPFFTTDTAAALRAAEIGAGALFKGTQVDGIYSADPKTNKDAKRFDNISHDEIIEKGLAVMDIAAVALTRDNNIPVVVFSIHEVGGLVEILNGKGRCTIVKA